MLILSVSTRYPSRWLHPRFPGMRCNLQGLHTSTTCGIPWPMERFSTEETRPTPFISQCLAVPSGMRVPGEGCCGSAQHPVYASWNVSTRQLCRVSTVHCCTLPHWQMRPSPAEVSAVLAGGSCPDPTIRSRRNQLQGSKVAKSGASTAVDSWLPQLSSRSRHF